MLAVMSGLQRSCKLGTSASSVERGVERGCDGILAACGIVRTVQYRTGVLLCLQRTVSSATHGVCQDSAVHMLRWLAR